MEKNSQTKSVFTISGRHRFVACVIVVILVSVNHQYSVRWGK